MSVYRYRTGAGWENGLEPRNNLCRLSVSVDYHTRPTFDFVDYNMIGKPIRIHGKRHWRDTLKRNGFNDDVHWRDGLNKKAKPKAVGEFSGKLDSVIEKVVREVSQKPYCSFGKKFTDSQIKDDFNRERNRLDNMRRAK